MQERVDNDKLRDTFISQHPTTAARKNIKRKDWDGLSDLSFHTDPFVAPSVVTDQGDDGSDDSSDEDSGGAGDRGGSSSSGSSSSSSSATDGGEQPAAKRSRYAAAEEGVTVGGEQDVDMVSQVADLGRVEDVDDIDHQIYQNADLVKQTSKVGEIRGALQAGDTKEEDVYAMYCVHNHSATANATIYASMQH
eukprot:SAG25_NODE_403_length_8470_cov_48.785506_3_plen_193_part_00